MASRKAKDRVYINAYLITPHNQRRVIFIDDYIKDKKPIASVSYLKKYLENNRIEVLDRAYQHLYRAISDKGISSDSVILYSEKV